MPEILADQYQLVQLLGQGGMGSVFKACDLLALQQQDPDPYVAVKVLSADLKDNPMAVMALQREANRAFKLVHPAIVRVKSFAQDRASGRYFLVMEYLEGSTLQDILRKHPQGQPWSEVARQLGPICDALQYAHSQGGLVHSDIKPNNLFITRAGQPKILDFGIAAPIPASEGEEPRTRWDSRQHGAGTPEYQSLDMFLQMKAHPSDDVYSLALVTYQWLSGRHAYRSDRLPGMLDARQALELNVTPEPLPGLTSWQNRALRRALALTRAKRTPTIEAFWREMTVPPLQNNPLAWGVAALLVAGLAAAGFALAPARHPPQTPGVPAGEGISAASPASAASASSSPPAGMPEVASSPPASSAAAPSPPSDDAQSTANTVAPAVREPHAAGPGSPVHVAPPRRRPKPQAPVVQVKLEDVCEGPASSATLERALREGKAAQAQLDAHAHQQSLANISAEAVLGQWRNCVEALDKAGQSTPESRRWLKSTQEE